MVNHKTIYPRRQKMGLGMHVKIVKRGTHCSGSACGKMVLHLIVASNKSLDHLILKTPTATICRDSQLVIVVERHIEYHHPGIIRYFQHLQPLFMPLAFTLISWYLSSFLGIKNTRSVWYLHSIWRFMVCYLIQHFNWSEGQFEQCQPAGQARLLCSSWCQAPSSTLPTDVCEINVKHIAAHE